MREQSQEQLANIETQITTEEPKDDKTIERALKQQKEVEAEETRESVMLLNKDGEEVPVSVGDKIRFRHSNKKENIKAIVKEVKGNRFILDKGYKSFKALEKDPNFKNLSLPTTEKEKEALDTLAKKLGLDIKPYSKKGKQEQEKKIEAQAKEAKKIIAEKESARKIKELTDQLIKEGEVGVDPEMKTLKEDTPAKRKMTREEAQEEYKKMPEKEESVEVDQEYLAEVETKGGKVETKEKREEAQEEYKRQTKQEKDSLDTAQARYYQAEMDKKAYELNGMWNTLVGMQHTLKGIKTGWFSPKVKFIGRLPKEFGAGTTDLMSGLELKNDEKLVDYLKKNDRIGEAENIEVYNSLLNNYRKLATDYAPKKRASRGLGKGKLRSAKKQIGSSIEKTGSSSMTGN